MSVAAVGKTPGPLSGVKVLELGQFVAGPYCGSILAYFGAEVIKVEPFNGDQLRKFRDVDESGNSFWWYSLGRNKKSVCIDLRTVKGQELIKDLALKSDVLIENFKPGTMKKWGLDHDTLKQTNPGLVYSSISGFGQTGPYASRPGFASACEAMGGLRYVNGFPDRPSVRPNLSIGDTMAGLNAALGTVMALFARGKAGVQGQVVDTAIYESVFGLMEGVLCDYSGKGLVRECSGSTITGIVPSNTYMCQDGKSIVIGANGDALFKRLCKQMGREHDMGNNPEYQDNQGRVKHQKYLDEQIGNWTLTMPAIEVKRQVDQCQVPNGMIYSIVDICEDEQYRARGQLETVKIEHWPEGKQEMMIPAIGPKLSQTPGRTEFPGRSQVGIDTDDVLKQVLGFSQSQLDELRASKVIA
ncbi:hypothetical protein BASA81_008665 [Batrachochytrium salamandrivorans]|nr:hypothetical protein BASA81_008665 [Batrachochytrium salamandrivorans]